MATTKPTKLTLRAYDVGFGDCFLLSFHYPRSDRHVLVDFGSMSLPAGKGGGGAYMERIANEIAKDCNGKLHAIVATHRHRDHISGFSMTSGKGPGAIIRGLKPDLVVQPWTEDPDAAIDASAPTKALRRQALYLQSLSHMNAYAAHAAQVGSRLRGGYLESVRRQLQFIGEDNIKNPEAVKNLKAMAKNRYVYFGAKSGLDTLLPGVKTRVLGPPTLKQSDAIRKQRDTDTDEFWHLQRARYWAQHATLAQETKGGGAPLFPKYVDRVPWDARWYAYQAQREYAESLLSIVRTLDEEMNNTSVILLFEVGNKSLLFPGDAQYENWMYALGKADVRAALAKVDVYKVGHHGSLNATPKTLWSGFSQRGAKTKTDRLFAMLSTKDDLHGSTNNRTEVPRSTLVAALDRESDLLDTRRYEKTQLSVSKLIELTR